MVTFNNEHVTNPNVVCSSLKNYCSIDYVLRGLFEYSEQAIAKLILTFPT